MLQRLIYLGYYLKKLEWAKFQQFFNHAKRETGKSDLIILFDVLRSSLKYNISLLEYFQFRFYKLSNKKRKQFAGTGFMYEYQLQMNPKFNRSVLADKLEFLSVYKKFVKHKYASLKELEQGHTIAEELLKNDSGKIVLKSSNGQCGVGVEVRNTTDFNIYSIIKQLNNTQNDFVEEFVVQHSDLMKLSPSGLNTVRVITQLNDKEQVDFLGARLRITINSIVDNLAAGNVAAPVNIETGIVEGPGVYSDITKPDEYIHPVTGVDILGFSIPFWNETIEMVRSAALLNKTNRSIGWDVAITKSGPELIEGNHDWCKLLWQLPVKKGLKSELEKYM